jgi:hypothetical protein
MKKKAIMLFLSVFFVFFAVNVRANVLSMQNGNLGVLFLDDSFGFNMGTCDSCVPADGALSFSYNETGGLALLTTHSVIKLDGLRTDGTGYDFYNTFDCPVKGGSVIDGGTYISGTKLVDSAVEVNFRLELVNNPALGSPIDTVKIKYTLTNVSGVTHTVAVRLELDTMVLGQDGAILSIDNGFTTLTTTTQWFKSLGQIPANWWDFDVDPTHGVPNLVGRGYTYNNAYDEPATEPDVMEIANWEAVQGTGQWTGEATGDDMISPDDSAVVFWWCNGDLSSSYTLPAGSTLSFVTYYGINKQPLLTTPTITPTYTQTYTRTPTFTITPTSSITRTSTITATSTPTGTQTFSPTITSTFTNSPTFTDSPTETATPTITPTYTMTDTFTDTPTVTETYTVTDTFTQTPTPTITMTFTPTPPPFQLIGKGNFPNPFDADTNIVYWLSTQAQSVKIMVYTVSGEKVFWDDALTGNAGYNNFYWNGRNRAMKPVASGVFIYRIDASDDRNDHASVTLKAVCVK